jgi:hypothetical protein
VPQTSATTVTGRARAARQLLSQADLTYLGYAELHNGPYGQGLTHRYVNGQLRMLYAYVDGSGYYQPFEFVMPSPFPYGGSTYSGIPRQIYRNLHNRNDGANLPPYGDGTPAGEQWSGTWWDESNQRLWTTACNDYPQGGVNTTAVSSLMWRNIPTANGNCTNHHGMWGYQDVGQRAVCGGIFRVPQWFRTANNVGQYVTGFGHYTSLMAQGLGPSLGPLFLFLDDPTGVFPVASSPMNSNAYTIPSSAYRIGADCRSGTVGACWYPGATYANRTLDRGIRKNLDVLNYYEGGDPRQNPTTRPTAPPLPAGKWQTSHPSLPLQGSPAQGGDPDRYGRWTWGDGYYGSVRWLDNDAGTAQRHGILAVCSLNQGVSAYHSSAGYSDGKVYEMHVYDPADVAACLAGTTQPWAVRPRNVWPLSLPNLPTLPAVTDWATTPPPAGTNGGLVQGMTYDGTTGKLYVMGAGTVAPYQRLFLYVFQGPVIS